MKAAKPDEPSAEVTDDDVPADLGQEGPVTADTSDGLARVELEVQPSQELGAGRVEMVLVNHGEIPLQHGRNVELRHWQHGEWVDASWADELDVADVTEHLLPGESSAPTTRPDTGGLAPGYYEATWHVTWHDDSGNADAVELAAHRSFNIRE